MMRAAMEKQAQAQMAKAPWLPLPRLLPPRASPPQTPQMVPPLQQPLPSSVSQPMTPYQQAVVLPSKPKERGVTFDASMDKLAATGSRDADDHERLHTRSWPDNTWPANQPSGGHAGSSARMTSTQMASQSSEYHSSASHRASTALRPRSSLHPHPSGVKAPKDPLKCLACYQSQGWKKDLELVFQAYYKLNFAFKASKWNRLRDKVIDHLTSLQEEWQHLKEKDPLRYIPYMEEQFFAATGVRLKGLADCTIWIKRGSYYHGLVAKQEQLHKCPHLAGIEPPHQPQMTPSESRLASQKRAEGPVTSASTPSMEASPLEVATVDAPAPMETGGAGDGWSWADQAQAEDDFQEDRPAKRCWSHSKRWEIPLTLPFPLQDEAGRRASVQQLYVNVGQ